MLRFGKGTICELEDSLQDIGDGDIEAGAVLINKIAMRLNQAKLKHRWGFGGEIDSIDRACAALQCEMDELEFATKHESPERQQDELLDVFAVAIRIANNEWKN